MWFVSKEREKRGGEGGSIVVVLLPDDLHVDEGFCGGAKAGGSAAWRYAGGKARAGTPVTARLSLTCEVGVELLKRALGLKPQ